MLAASRLRPVVIATDKFKGSLTAAEAATRTAAGLRRHSPQAELRLAPVADGGDGTVEVLAVAGFSSVPVVVTGPTGQPVEARFARRGLTAVIEMAQASGLGRLPGGRTDPMHATSRGTGELIAAALDLGCSRVIVGLGGSASTDGGAGMLQALGARLLDAHGRDLAGGGAALATLVSIELDGLDRRLQRASIVLASDVDNPLLGPAGTAAVYARQKGASDDEVSALEQALHRWAVQLREVTGRDDAGEAGAGAAGGVGFAAMSALGASPRPGVDVILDLLDFEALLSGAQLVITGEGSLDQQSLHGKAPIGVAAAAARQAVPVVAIVGRSTLSVADERRAGLGDVFTLASLEPDEAASMRDAGRLIEQLAADRIAPQWFGRDRHAGA